MLFTKPDMKPRPLVSVGFDLKIIGDGRGKPGQSGVMKILHFGGGIRAASLGFDRFGQFGSGRRTDSVAHPVFVSLFSRRPGNRGPGWKVAWSI